MLNPESGKAGDSFPVIACDHELDVELSFWSEQQASEALWELELVQRAVDPDIGAGAGLLVVSLMRGLCAG